MSDIYRHDQAKFADSGLQLRLPVDLVPSTQYSVMSNALTVIEGTLRGRTGTASVASVGAGVVHTIFRLNQQNSAVSPERLVGIGSDLYSQQLPSGAFSLLSGPVYDGNPLIIIPFRFDGDPNSWALISNSNAMQKRRRPSLYWQLGITPPASAATATAGGAGAITGNNYDWRCTYVYSVTNSESNPSPLDVTVGNQYPTNYTTPDPISGGGPCTNPADAYDGNDATYAEFTGDSSVPNADSCRYFGWAGIGTVDGLTLNIDSEVLVTGTDNSVVASVFYSTDNGTSWNTIYSTLVARGRLTDTLTLPTGVDLTKLIVRAVASGAGTGGGDTGGGGGGYPCPLSGAPVKLYGEPEWWKMEVEPQEDLIEITTETGRKGTFSPLHRLFSDQGLIPLNKWVAGMFAMIDEPETHMERVKSIRAIRVPGATVDHYHALDCHVFSAWGFLGHNAKKEEIPL